MIWVINTLLTFNVIPNSASISEASYQDIVYLVSCTNNYDNKLLTRFLLSILMLVNAFLKSALSAIGKRFLRSLRLVAQSSEPRVWVIRAASSGLHWRSHLRSVNATLKG